MLTTLKNAFKMKELRKKIFYTFAMLVVIRLGSQLPVPGVDRTYRCVPAFICIYYIYYTTADTKSVIFFVRRYILPFLCS